MMGVTDAALELVMARLDDPDGARATSADVAELAGVSRATVSFVLNDRADEIGISVETRSRVTAAAAQLGYEPNHAARSLRRRRTNMIAFMLSSPDSFYNSEVVAAAHAAANARGYALNIMSAKSRELESRAFALLQGGVADGVIVTAPPSRMLDELKRLTSRGAPVVILQHHSPDIAIPSVRVDLEAGGYIATKHLIDLGHRRIAHIANESQHLQQRRDRTDGYVRALSEIGLPANNELVVPAETTLEGGFAAMQALLDRAMRPTAVFVYNDQMAIGALHALRVRGLRAPDDIAIVGFDGIALGAFVTPELTTVDHARDEIGRLAVEAVVGRLNGDLSQPRELVLPVNLIVRQSCGGQARMAAVRHQGDRKT